MTGTNDMIRMKNTNMSNIHILLFHLIKTILVTDFTKNWLQILHFSQCSRLVKLARDIWQKSVIVDEYQLVIVYWCLQHKKCLCLRHVYVVVQFLFQFKFFAPVQMFWNQFKFFEPVQNFWTRRVQNILKWYKMF